MDRARQQVKDKVQSGWESFAQESAFLSRINHENRLRSLYGAKIPEIYRGLTFDGFIALAGDEQEKRAAILVAKQLHTTKEIKLGGATFTSVLVWGKPGVGKTGLFTPVFQELSAGRTSLWISLLDLTNAINDGYRTDQAYQRLNAARDVDFLFLDDVGDPQRKTATDGMRTSLQAIIWHRHANRLPTIMTSNLSPDALKVHFSDAIYQRMATMALIIEMGGKVLRNL